MKPITDFQFGPALLTSENYFWNCKTLESVAAYHKKLKRRSDNDYQALLSITQNNRKLFSLISSVTQTLDGWCSVPKAAALAALTTAMNVQLAIEIGVWAGRSLLPVAFAMKAKGSGQIKGIDPYTAKASAADEFGENLKWWDNQKMHDDIKAKFWDHVKKFDVIQHVDLIEKKSDDVDITPPDPKWKLEADLLHIDGNHQDQAIRDAERFGPLVRLGGIVVCDDLKWQGGGPLRAIDALEDMGFIELFRVEGDGDCWNAMQKVK